MGQDKGEVEKLYPVYQIYHGLISFKDAIVFPQFITVFQV